MNNKTTFFEKKQINVFLYKEQEEVIVVFQILSEFLVGYFLFTDHALAVFAKSQYETGFLDIFIELLLIVVNRTEEVDYISISVSIISTLVFDPSSH